MTLIHLMPQGDGHPHTPDRHCECIPLLGTCQGHMAFVHQPFSPYWEGVFTPVWSETQSTGARLRRRLLMAALLVLAFSAGLFVGAIF